MVTLSLLRHAKSSWNAPLAEDFDRPLARRGLEAAPAMGRFIRDAGLAPDLILCSPARRTRQTLDLILSELSPRPLIVFQDDLYPAAPDEILGHVREIGEPHRHVMVVAHNPGLQTLARDLAGEGDPEPVAGLATKFPTCALAVLDFPDGWASVGPKRGRLRLFMTPKLLCREKV